ncbi:MAG: ATPase domain-containing protein, partial [Thermaurantiacus sp.]
MGGLVAGGAYMVRGSAGTGKTMLGLHFLTDGVQQGEKVLFVTLSETEKRIRRNAASLGFDLEGIEMLDLTPDSQFFAQMQGYDLFTAADAEHEPMTRKIVEAIEAIKPQRIFLDSITQLSRQCFAWCKTQPGSVSDRTGKTDLRAAYGLLG